ncbi:conjugal transfer protein TraD [Rhizobium bangladeshense]|uniref:conjugal transfer protein TraD n=1 Tax=Rhizobium bangladeshense TaxID=1138189 RepID=UPI0007E53EEE|nr:conjugal transfer protein TraD [Rhizobium bangladeshense]
MTADRKQGARERFLLGGLVVKAGLTRADRAFLLGGFLELAGIAPESSEHRRLRDIGEEAFKNSKLDGSSQRIAEAAE